MDRRYFVKEVKGSDWNRESIIRRDWHSRMQQVILCSTHVFHIFCVTVTSCCLTGVAADGEVMERAQAFACAHVQRAVLYDSPQTERYPLGVHNRLIRWKP